MSLIFECSDVSSANILHIDLNHQVNRFYKTKTTNDLRQSLVVLLLEYKSILMFSHSVEHVAGSFSNNSELGLEVCFQHRMT